MNTTTATIIINLTGTITLDTNTLQQLAAGLQTSSVQLPAATQPSPAAKADLVYTVPEAAKILKVGTKSIYRLIYRRHLRSTGAMRVKRITHAEIKRFLKATPGLYD